MSAQDNWAWNDVEVYQKNKSLWIFTDLDFIWMATPKGFASEVTEKIFKRHLAERKRGPHSLEQKISKEND